MTDRKGPSSGSLEREWIKSLKEFSESMRTQVASPWHGTWTEKRSLPIKWVPLPPAECPPHTQRCAFQRLLPSPWAHYFCAPSNPGLRGFKCVSVEAEWHWTLTEQQWGPLSHQRSPPALCETLGTKSQEGGALRGSQRRSETLH